MMPDASANQTSQQDISFIFAARLWWSFTWRTIALNSAIGTFVGLIAGIILLVIHPEMISGDYKISLYAKIIIVMINIIFIVPVNIWAMQKILMKYRCKF